MLFPPCREIFISDVNPATNLGYWQSVAVYPTIKDWNADIFFSGEFLLGMPGHTIHLTFKIESGLSHSSGLKSIQYRLVYNSSRIRTLDPFAVILPFSSIAIN
jgi:hypothetical protein